MYLVYDFHNKYKNIVRCRENVLVTEHLSYLVIGYDR